jgi:hypothetical protein
MSLGVNKPNNNIVSGEKLEEFTIFWLNLLNSSISELAIVVCLGRHK